MYIVSGSRPVGHIINGAANDFPSESGNGVSMISSVDSRSFFYWNNDQGRRKGRGGNGGNRPARFWSHQKTIIVPSSRFSDLPSSLDHGWWSTDTDTALS